MLITDFFSWWYGRGWRLIARRSLTQIRHIFDLFSVQLLLRTLLSPWRRIITYPGASLEARLRAMADNFFSRLVGFVVRILVLLAAGLSGVVIGILGLLTLLVWPLLPVVPIACLAAGVLL